MGSASPPPPTPDLTVDVLIVGGGPVGLSLAYQLQRFNPNTTLHIIEKHPKPAQQAFGRAVTFWPRTMELLSQIAIADPICQLCCSVRSSAAYDSVGEEMFGRGWSFLEGIEDTRWRFASVLRQKFVEGIFEGELGKLGVCVRAPCAFEGMGVDEGVERGGYRVRALLRDQDSGEEYTVRCKYLIGCDGSRTVVRGAAGIESEGSRTEDKWVRIDGVLSHTTMPKPRSYGALESPVYGNVLWIPLDHGATRIGFALNEERRRLYSELTEEVFVKEAKEAVRPFEIEYSQVDWASVYSVGQRLAKTFWTKGCVFLAGDSAHTHSSGAGQGMNNGQHDAVNLAWKLSLVLGGVAKDELLETYDLERQPNAERLIRYDEDISVLVSGRLPKGWKGDPNEDPAVVLGQILDEAKGFNTGLSVNYAGSKSMLVRNDTRNALNREKVHTETVPTPALPGYRAPDVKLSLPALLEPVWLQEVTPNNATFYIIAFTGDVEKTRSGYRDFADSVKASILLTSSRAEMNGKLVKGQTAADRIGQIPVDFLTIIAGTEANAWHAVGTEPFGKVFYDQDGSAHDRYEVNVEEGMLMILRPDGWIGARLSLGSIGVVGEIEAYFRLFLRL
jgi:phenol 2-monooxygenase